MVLFYYFFQDSDVDGAVPAETKIFFGLLVIRKEGAEVDDGEVEVLSGLGNVPVAIATCK